jgi:hypothetical protein
MNTPTTPPTPDTPDAATPQDAPDTQDAATTQDLSPSPETRADSLADEMFVDDGRTAALPTTSASATDTASATTTAIATAPAPASAPESTDPPEPQWLTGPAPFALVLGLLGLLVAGTVLLTELTDWTLPWGDLGPWSVVAAGLVVLLVGAIGLRSSRSRD